MVRSSRAFLLIALCLSAFAEATAGQALSADAAAGQDLVVSVLVEQEGIPLAEPVITSLIETTPGEPLLMHQVRETITHLMSLNRYEDVQVFQEPVPGGVRVRYLLVPLHPIDRLEYRGALGVDEGDLRRAIADDRQPVANGTHAVAALRVIDAAYASSASGTRVQIAESND